MTNLQGTSLSSGVMTAMGTVTTMKKMTAREASQRAQKELENARDEKKIEIKKQEADTNAKKAEAYAKDVDNRTKNDEFNRSEEGMKHNLQMQKEKTKQAQANAEQSKAVASGKRADARREAMAKKKSGGDNNEL